MTSVAPDARRIWRAARAPLVIAVIVLIGAVVVLLGSAGQQRGSLDPESVQPGGSRALARLLEQQGVRIVPARTYAEAEAALRGEATLLVTGPDAVEPGRLAALRSRATDAVLVGPGDPVLDILVPGVVVSGEVEPSAREPGCTVAGAVAAGNAVLGGFTYEAHGRARGCYDGTLLQLPGDRGTTTILGDGTPMTNDRLDEVGDAALTMRLLGRHATLVWYVPTPGDTGAGLGARSFTDLIPRPWLFGAIQLGVAAVLFALWRARRLGPVVTEQLPVVVRAAETTEGRARLYRRAGAADHAAATLRQAAIGRMRPLLGLGAGAEPAAVVAAAAARTGRPGAAVGELLYGPAPGDDAGLVRLADELDRIEREIS
ncbi:hypothetical protein GCM10017786_67530 [Amycolatopsis deserti]|uniref:DUF4350 domain-containing protein n=1 Tax=Amycolatopsis deserti TaxID=185696 RepID=A0ABQ3JHM3_9PSEU|nr:DUF4350 domain-containing protein [Amycolatopsis deserti]GHF23796.1 hypothetical protein GCM10017786_67530 [Amycolatopsis deserti]